LTARVVTLNPTTIDFGAVYMGTSPWPTRTVTLTNTGSAPLFISDISICGDDADFPLDQPPNTWKIHPWPRGRAAWSQLDSTPQQQKFARLLSCLL